MSFNPTPPQPFIGLWKNHADGGQLTLTLEETQAGLLSSFLVIFAGISALAGWNIVRFALHQFRTVGNTHDGMHHQIQAILRNSTGLVHALQLIFQVANAWRARLGFARVAQRLSGIFLVAFIFFVATTFAQLFVSFTWSTAGAQFLVQSSSCNVFLPDVPTERLRSDQAEYIYLKSRLEAAMMYERLCYSAGADVSAPECSRFPVPVIEIEEQDIPCPFPDSSLCITTNSVPVRFVATVNSNRHLGINADARDTIIYRRTAECSPIQSDHTIRRADATAFMYGPFAQNEETFLYSDTLRSVDNYRIEPYVYDSASAAEGLIGWMANTTLIGPPAEANNTASIFFIQTNNVTNVVPTNDPIFTEDGSDPPVKVLACREEHEFCNPSVPGMGGCRKFTPNDLVWEFLTPIAMNDRQASTAMRVAINLLRQDIAQVVGYAPGDIVMAGKTVLYGEQYDNLPVDQWRKEVRRWFAMALYLLQSDAVQFATPQKDATLLPFFKVLDEDPWVASCMNQRIRNADGVRNFNFLAIVLIMSVGFIVIIVASFVEPLVALFRRMSGHGDERMLTWVFDGVFQLQRLAYGAVGVEKWEPGVADVPTTDEKEWPVIDLKVVATADSVYELDMSPVSRTGPITPITPVQRTAPGTPLSRGSPLTPIKTHGSWVVKREV